MFLSLWGDRTGPYLGLGYGLGYYDPGSRLIDVKTQPQNVRLYGGAYINENLSVELGLVEYGGAQMGYDLTNFQAKLSNNGTDVEESFRAVTVSTLAHYPFYHNTFDLFGRFGAGSMGRRSTENVIDSQRDTATLVFGGGVTWRIVDNFSFVMGYDHYTFRVDTIDTTLDSTYFAFEIQFK